MKKFMLACCLTLLLNDCTSLLPRQQATTISQWGSFESARSTFDHIPTGAATTDDLKKLGLDPFDNQNVTILNYSDLARRLLLPTANLPADYLDPALSKCLAERELCYAYEVDIRHTDRNRIGSFWLDFFQFSSYDRYHRMAFQRLVCHPRAEGRLQALERPTGHPRSGRRAEAARSVAGNR